MMSICQSLFSEKMKSQAIKEQESQHNSTNGKNTTLQPKLTLTCFVLRNNNFSKKKLKGLAACSNFSLSLMKFKSNCAFESENNANA